MIDGTVVISPYNAALEPEIVAEADKIKAGYMDGSFDIFTGPIYDTEGTLKVADGVKLTLEELAVMDWFVKGVETAA